MDEKKKKIGTLIKTFNGKRRASTGDIYDVIVMWYRDENGIKRAIYYDRPKVPYYIINDKNSPEAKNAPLYIPADKVTMYETYSDSLLHDIAEHTGCTGYYDKILSKKGNNAYEMKNLFRHPYVYNADMNLQDRFIAAFNEEYEPDKSYKLHKGYLDIEVDLAPNGLTPDKHGNVGYMDFPHEDIAPCPINIMTLIDEKTMTIYTFVVRNTLNTSLKETESNIDIIKEEILTKIKDEDHTTISEFKVRFFNDELSAIEALFAQIHECDFDYLGSWNQCYDAITLMNRAIQLYNKKPELKQQGISATTAMKKTFCDLKYASYMVNGKNHTVNLVVDYKANKDMEIGKRIDFFNIFDGINWVDSEYYYALSHAGSGKKDNYKLDTIANEELNKEKLPFKPGQTIKNLPWLCFSQFLEYNVRDVLLLYLLEQKTLDFNTLQALSEVTNTRKEKVYSKSISLPNFVNKFAKTQNYVMNCNKNKKYISSFTDATGKTNIGFDDFGETVLEQTEIIEHDPKYKEVFDQRDRVGAYCSDPMQNERIGLELVEGQLSMHLFKNVCDADLASLYPSTYRVINIDSGTLLGKFFLVDEKIKSNLKQKYGYNGMFKLAEKDTEELEDDDTVDADNEDELAQPETNDLGPTVVDSLLSQDWESIGKKYFFLPDIEETYKNLDEIIKKKKHK